MTKKRIVTIDFNKECTIKTYSEMKNVSTNVISNWVKRGKIKYRIVPELNDLCLVTIDSEEVNS